MTYSSSESNILLGRCLHDMVCIALSKFQSHGVVVGKKLVLQSQTGGRGDNRITLKIHCNCHGKCIGIGSARDSEGGRTIDAPSTSKLATPDTYRCDVLIKHASTISHTTEKAHLLQYTRMFSKERN
jgi:hypothetical protein